MIGYKPKAIFWQKNCQVFVVKKKKWLTINNQLVCNWHFPSIVPSKTLIHSCIWNVHRFHGETPIGENYIPAKQKFVFFSVFY